MLFAIRLTSVGVASTTQILGLSLHIEFRVRRVDERQMSDIGLFEHGSKLATSSQLLQLICATNMRAVDEDKWLASLPS